MVNESLDNIYKTTAVSPKELYGAKHYGTFGWLLDNIKIDLESSPEKVPMLGLKAQMDAEDNHSRHEFTTLDRASGNWEATNEEDYKIRINGEFVYQSLVHNPVQKSCECGSDKVGSSQHSSWCPKHG